jgi:hypothetical protein
MNASVEHHGDKIRVTIEYGGHLLVLSISQAKQWRNAIDRAIEKAECEHPYTDLGTCIDCGGKR